MFAIHPETTRSEVWKYQSQFPEEQTSQEDDSEIEYLPEWEKESFQ